MIIVQWHKDTENTQYVTATVKKSAYMLAPLLTIIILYLWLNPLHASSLSCFIHLPFSSIPCVFFLSLFSLFLFVSKLLCFCCYTQAVLEYIAAPPALYLRSAGHRRHIDQRDAMNNYVIPPFFSLHFYLQDCAY